MATPDKRPSCTISVDVDSLDSVLKFYGTKQGGLSGADPVYGLAVPRFLKLFDECGIKATFLSWQATAASRPPKKLSGRS